MAQSVRITGGTHRGRVLRSPRATNLRPTSDRVRGALFSILGVDAVDGARVLDLYAGTGALGIEALSRGAMFVDFVEVNARLARQIRENLAELSLAERGRVHRARVGSVLESLCDTYDLVFADPPYDVDDWEPLMNRLQERRLLAEGALITAEHRYNTVLAKQFGKLTLWTSRRYGDTSISIYRLEQEQES